MNNLNNNLLFDLLKMFGAQKKKINKKLLPAVKTAMNPSLEVYDIEILKIIKQLHKSRRETWKVQEEGRTKDHNKRMHMTSRRKQV